MSVQNSNRVSVITIIKDDNLGLQRTLNSILAQKTLGIQVRVLIVDGSMTENPLHVIERFHQLEIVTLRRPAKGVYNAMNQGLSYVLSDDFGQNSSIVFLNAGDFFVNPNALYLMSEMNKLSPLVVGNAVMLNPKTKPDIMQPKIIFGSGEEFMHPNIFWMPHQGFSAQASVFDRIGFFNESYKIAGDYDWILRAVNEYGLPSIIPDILVAQMIGGISNSRSYSGYRERAQIAEVCNLVENKLPRLLVGKMLLKEWLHSRGVLPNSRESIRVSMKMGELSQHEHEQGIECAWCFFESFSQ